jgi:hypothetical protein
LVRYTIKEKIMCWGKSSTPDLPATPAPQPTPTPAAQPGEVAASAESKRNKIAGLRMGGMATIKNQGGAAGLTGKGVDLSNPQLEGKKVLGA